MTRFSANLGFLWTDRSLPDAIRAAKSAGFDAVECHWPYDTPSRKVKAALKETGLRMLGLNTRRGNVENGENGLCAIPGREEEARRAIAEAMEYAQAIDAQAVHVMPGNATGDLARKVFIENLRVACEMGKDNGIIVLVEPLNRFDAPGYFLNTLAQARDLIEDVGAPNLKLMFDCYHVGRTEGDVLARLRSAMPIIGHIQIASVPDRGAPDHGDVDYGAVFAELEALGWSKPLGAEYKPVGHTDCSLHWMEGFVRGN